MKPSPTSPKPLSLATKPLIPNATKPMLVTKVCTTLKQAENLQSQLYAKWDSVELIKCPTFTESGTYIFKVADTSD